MAWSSGGLGKCLGYVITAMKKKDKGVVEGMLGKMPSLYGSGTQLGPE